MTAPSETGETKLGGAEGIRTPVRMQVRTSSALTGKQPYLHNTPEVGNLATTLLLFLAVAVNKRPVHRSQLDDGPKDNGEKRVEIDDSAKCRVVVNLVPVVNFDDSLIHPPRQPHPKSPNNCSDIPAQ